jgi:SAM-dependent methyltransferase
MIDDHVQAQYEAYPYPARNPHDEAKRLRVVSPSQLFQLNHFAFGGQRDLKNPLRVLVAGGGTGDAAIMLGQQMIDAGVPGTVTHLDLSAESQDIARQRAQVRGLDNIEYVQGSLLDVGELGLGTFDYIDCCGVLHHLEDPLAGLHSLISVLAPDGGLGIMVYGELGRTGVYHVQDMLRTLAPVDDDASSRVETAKRLLQALPPTNWFVRNGQLTDHKGGGDAGVFDLLLHSQDRAYRVPELV